MKEIIQKIAKLVCEHNGNTYYVGGYVRDEILGIKSKDIDIEVHGIDEKTLLDVIAKVGEPLSYGKSFGIYSIKDTNIDIALPRIETKTGEGHKDFNVEIDPNIDLIKCISRRDFTINSIYKNVLTNEIIDPYNGINDIENKIIRHIDDVQFIEDPLRVLRAAQFASRFNFKIDKKTIELCKSIDISKLSKQRVNQELYKALTASKDPTIFFINLSYMNQLDYWFNNPNIDLLAKANKYINNINNKYAYLLSALSINSSFDINKFIDENKIITYVNNMKQYINAEVNSDVDIYKLFTKLVDIIDYVYLRLAINEKDIFLLEKINPFSQIMNEPYITGDDLIELGYKPGTDFASILEYVNELRFKQVPKQEAIKLISKISEPTTKLV